MNSVNDIPDYEDELVRLSKTQELDFSAMISEFFYSIFNISMSPFVLELLQWVMWIAIVVFVGWIVFKELGLIGTTKKAANDEVYEFTGPSLGTAEDADIRGHNLTKELKEALSQGNFAEAVHVRYLITLQRLDNQKLIDWKPFKTPMMYVSEMKRNADVLGDITMAFLYIKYGHYPATQEIYDEVTATSNLLISTKEGGDGYEG